MARPTERACASYRSSPLKRPARHNRTLTSVSGWDPNPYYPDNSPCTSDELRRGR